jgi:hypothetical protein
LVLYQVITKDEGNNLTSMAPTLHSIMSCELLNIPQIYEGSCFGCVLFKDVKIHSTNDDKVSMCPRKINVKYV